MEKVSTVRHSFPGTWNDHFGGDENVKLCQGISKCLFFFLRVLVGTCRIRVKSGLQSSLRQQHSRLWICVRAWWGWWLHENRHQQGSKVHPGDEAKDGTGDVLQCTYMGSIQARSGCLGLS